MMVLNSELKSTKPNDLWVVDLMQDEMKTMFTSLFNELFALSSNRRCSMMSFRCISTSHKNVAMATKVRGVG